MEKTETPINGNGNGNGNKAIVVQDKTTEKTPISEDQGDSQLALTQAMVGDRRIVHTARSAVAQDLKSYGKARTAIYREAMTASVLGMTHAEYIKRKGNGTL